MIEPGALPWFYPDAETEAERDRILRSRFFLVRIGGNGDVWRCRRCHGRHPYLTLMCVPQPFSGLGRGLYAYWKTVGAAAALTDLTPSERARLADLDRAFGPGAGLADLATSHPETARAVGTAERDADLGAYSFVASVQSSTALGVVEPITRAEAARFVRRINLRGIKPPLVVPGLEES
jgi:hypothetical protein